MLFNIKNLIVQRINVACREIIALIPFMNCFLNTETYSEQLVVQKKII